MFLYIKAIGLLKVPFYANPGVGGYSTIIKKDFMIQKIVKNSALRG